MRKPPLLLFLLALATGCASPSSGGARSDAKPASTSTPEQCEATFDMAFTRSCVTASDCVLLVHSDCCHEIDIGVSRANLPAAMAAETTFNACEGPACGGRGCGGQTSAEDGKIPVTGQSIVATCVAQVCTSTVQ